jgi:hypothetical protein
MTMKKSLSIFSTGVLATALTIPMGRAYALDPPGNHRERQELREDSQQLDRLTMQRNRELRQGDFREAREYDEKIRDQRREVRRDWRELYRDDSDAWHSERRYRLHESD